MSFADRLAEAIAAKPQPCRMCSVLATLTDEQRAELAAADLSAAAEARVLLVGSTTVSKHRTEQHDAR